MKLEPINLTIPISSNNNNTGSSTRKASKSPSRRSAAITPTRIPIPKPPSALSTGSSSINEEINTGTNIPTPHLFGYTSSEDESLLKSSRKNKLSSSTSANLNNNNNNNLALTPPILERKKSLRSSELSMASSTKSSPKSSPKMKLSRSVSTGGGLNQHNNNSSTSLNGPILQRKSSSRRIKTPTNQVPKLPNAQDLVDSSSKSSPKTKHIDHQHRHHHESSNSNKNDINGPIYIEQGSLVRTTSLHSTRKKTMAGPSDTQTKGKLKIIIKKKGYTLIFLFIFFNIFISNRET